MRTRFTRRIDTSSSLRSTSSLTLVPMPEDCLYSVLFVSETYQNEKRKLERRGEQVFFLFYYQPRAEVVPSSS